MVRAERFGMTITAKAGRHHSQGNSGLASMSAQQAITVKTAVAWSHWTTGQVLGQRCHTTVQEHARPCLRALTMQWEGLVPPTRGGTCR